MHLTAFTTIQRSSEEDQAVKDSYIGLITLTRRTLEICIGLLGIEAPERM